MEISNKILLSIYKVTLLEKSVLCCHFWMKMGIFPIALETTNLFLCSSFSGILFKTYHFQMFIVTLKTSIFLALSSFDYIQTCFSHDHSGTSIGLVRIQKYFGERFSIVIKYYEKFFFIIDNKKLFLSVPLSLFLSQAYDRRKFLPITSAYIWKHINGIYPCLYTLVYSYLYLILGQLYISDYIFGKSQTIFKHEYHFVPLSLGFFSSNLPYIWLYKGRALLQYTLFI